jgi:hypothetical protein
MKNIISLFLLAFFVHQKAGAQSYLPVATTGYTCDAVAENTTAISTTSGPLDGVNVMYSVAYAALVSSSYGLPNSGLLTSTTKTFQLQSYIGPNMLFIPHATQDSLTFVTPVACQSLSILDFATDAYSPTTMSITVRFTDNTTQVFSPNTVYDWLYTGATPFASGFDRLNRSTGSPENEGGLGYPFFFTNDLAISCANQSKQIKRIIFQNTGSASENLCILAVSAVLVPLTATASPANLCNTSGSATLTAGGVSNYTWLPAGNFAGATGTAVSVTPSITTVYTVQAVNTQSCTFNAMVTVNVYSAVPTLTISNTANSGGICPNHTVMLTASGATSYSWTGGSSTVTNGIAFSPTIAANYMITGYNACGSTTAVTSVSVHPFPTVNPAASSASICSGNSVTLTATGNATNYVWAGGIVNGAGFSPTITATYTVIGTSALSCTAAATIPVTVATTPSLAPTIQPGIVCIGNTATLIATGATNYTWTTSTQTLYTSSIAVTPSSVGVSTYTITKANVNCVDTKTIGVTTNSLPTIFAIVTPTLVCALTPATLAVGGAQTYTWTAPAPNSYTFTGASPVVTPPVTSIYTVAASDGTCINTTTVLLATNPDPTITIVQTASIICNTQSVGLTASGGINYTWTANTAIFNTQSIVDTPTASIAYNVIGDNSFGCTSQAGTIVLVNPNPTITATASKTLVCNAGPSTLTAIGANTFTWDPSASGALTPTTIVYPTSLSTGVAIYTVSGTYTATGCHISNTVQVHVFIPTITVTGNTNTCYGGAINLTASGANTGSYSWNTGNSNPYTFPSISNTITAATVYTVSALTTSASVVCPSTKTVALGIYLNPTITATAQRTTICKGEFVDLQGNGGTTYTWSNTQTSETITVHPTSQITYTLNGTDANGCVGTATILLKVLGCTGLNELTAQNNAVFVYPNPNNGEFVIQANADMTLTLSNELGQIIRTISVSSTNDYKVFVTDLAKGIYFITGKKENEQINQKIIVAK